MLDSRGAAFARRTTKICRKKLLLGRRLRPPARISLNDAASTLFHINLIVCLAALEHKSGAVRCERLVHLSAVRKGASLSSTLPFTHSASYVPYKGEGLLLCTRVLSLQSTFPTPALSLSHSLPPCPTEECQWH